MNKIRKILLKFLEILSNIYKDSKFLVQSYTPDSLCLLFYALKKADT